MSYIPPSDLSLTSLHNSSNSTSRTIRQSNSSQSLTSQDGVIVRVPLLPNFFHPSLSYTYTDFSIPSAELTRTSDFFDRICSTPRLGLEPRVIILHNATPLMFDIYNRWLRHRGKPLTVTEAKAASSTAPMYWKTSWEEKMREDYAGLMNCYDLASILEDNLFKDALMTRLISLLRAPTSTALPHVFISLITPTRAKHIFEEYALVSPIHQLVLCAVARFASLQQLENIAMSEEYPRVFKQGLYAALEGLKYRSVDECVEGAKDFAGEGCWWHHKHRVGEICPAFRK